DSRLVDQANQEDLRRSFAVWKSLLITLQDLKRQRISADSLNVQRSHELLKLHENVSELGQSMEDSREGVVPRDLEVALLRTVGTLLAVQNTHAPSELPAIHDTYRQNLSTAQGYADWVPTEFRDRFDKIVAGLGSAEDVFQEQLSFQR